MLAREAEDPFKVAFKKLEDERKTLFDIELQLQSWEAEVAVADVKVKEAERELLETIQRRDVLEEDRTAALDRINIAFGALENVVKSSRSPSS